MSLQLQLNPGSNWHLFYTQSFESIPIGPKTYKPIKESVLPVQIDFRVFVAYTTSSTAKLNWRLAGYLTPEVETGAAFVDLQLRQIALRLRSPQLIVLPSFSTSYKLRLRIPYWVEDLTLSLFQYTGPISDSVQEHSLLADFSKADATQTITIS